MFVRYDIVAIFGVSRTTGIQHFVHAFGFRISVADIIGHVVQVAYVVMLKSSPFFKNSILALKNRGGLCANRDGKIDKIARDCLITRA
uniref:Uncharacterized protein n=1 Tax=Romanomermis culicivorax TaxID=13658 RepID=A0A915J9J9_ROMCU